jgi:NADH-quinone oxidoreductase subunit A
MILTRYIFIGVLLLAAIGFALAPLVVVWLIAPRKRSMSKGDTYECGVLTHGETWVRFRIQYYIYALLFVVFDIETVFLYPWAVSFGDLSKVPQLGWFVLLEMIVFLVMLVVGLAYAWARGFLKWI